MALVCILMYHLYTYAPAGGFIGQEYSYDGSAWFERKQLTKNSEDNIALLTETNLRTLISGEDQDNDVLSVETKFGYEIVSRAITNAIIGTTGAAGDILERIEVMVIPTTDPLTISDGGVIIHTIPLLTPIGTILEIGHMCKTAFVIDSHASGVGTIKAVGRFS